MWILTFAFAVLWAFLLLPIGMNINLADGGNVNALLERKISAFGATVPMFLYVMGGIWIGRFFIYLGLSVTALTLFGYLFAGGWFHLWMAITGGGALIVSGMFIRRLWS